MEKWISSEGDGFSKLAQEITKGGYNKAIDIEIGKVIAPPPDIIIRVDSSPILLDKYDLIIAEHLTRHDRIVTIEHEELKERQLGDKVEQDYLDTDDKAAPITSYRHNFVKLRFEDLLKKGDRIIVARLDEQMLYVILDRARWY